MYRRQVLTTGQKKTIKDKHKVLSFFGTPEKMYTDSGLWKFLPKIRTKDEHDSLNPIKPLPKDEQGRMKEYMQVVFLIMLICPHLLIVKSRQIMMSWMMASFFSWYARTAPFRKIMWMNQNDSDAQAMVTRGDKLPLVGRMSFIEHHLPGDIRDPDIVSGKGNLAGNLIFCNQEKARGGIPVLGRGSQIIAVPHGADQPRSHVPTVFGIDEAAFVEDFGEAFANALPACERILGISTADQGDFCELVREGEKEGLQTVPEWSKFINMPTGMQVKETPAGMTVLYVHYTADPDKRPGTVKGDAWLNKRLTGYVGGMNSPKWRREMEMDFDIMGGTPVYEFLASLETPIIIPPKPPKWVRENLKLSAGFDYGSTNPSALVVSGKDRVGQDFTVHELYEPCHNYVKMAAKIKSCPYFDEINGKIKADPSMWAQTQQLKSGKTSIAALFAEEGVKFTPGNKGCAEDIAYRYLGHYWADPKNPKAFIFSTCVETIREWKNLRWEEHTSAKTAKRRNKPEKIMDKNNHTWDAKSYDEDQRPPPLKIEDAPIKGVTLDKLERNLRKQERAEKFSKEYVGA